MLEQKEICCNTNDGYEDEDDMVICNSCKEWTCQVRCEVCHDVLFESSCCG